MRCATKASGQLGRAVASRRTDPSARRRGRRPPTDADLDSDFDACVTGRGISCKIAFELITHDVELRLRGWILNNPSSYGCLPEVPTVPVRLERARPATIGNLAAPLKENASAHLYH